MLAASRRGIPLLILCTLSVSVALPSVVGAQVGRVTVGTGPFLETYRFSDAPSIGIQSLSLMTMPYAVATDLSSTLRLQASGAWARGALKRSDGSDVALSGPTDTEIRLSATVGNDALTLTAIGLVPTGISKLDREQADLAGMVAADLLPFKISNWGSGGGIGASAAVARAVGEYAVGVSGGFVVAREFEPVEGPAFRYRPGNQLHVRAAVDRSFGSASKGSLTLTWEGYGADQANGSNLFQAGDRMQAVGNYAFPVGRDGSGVAWAGWLRRAEGEFISSPRPDPVRTLLFAGAGGRIPVGRSVVQPLMELRLQDVAQGESGFTLSVGASAELPRGSVVAVPTLRGRLGSVTLGGDRKSAFTGVEIGLLLRFGGARR